MKGNDLLVTKRIFISCRDYKHRSLAHLTSNQISFCFLS